jgi:hypothetical protein
MDHKLNCAISFGLVGAMFAHASESLWHGKALSEVHLITSAPLINAVVSTSHVDTYSSVWHHNTIFDAVHAASIPQESELRLGGLTNPST